MKEIRKLTDSVKIQSFRTAENEAFGTETLNGLILTGYETKFTGEANTNGEIYTKGAVDNFINDYFVKNDLNMPLYLQHKDDLQHICGKVLKFVVNDNGYHIEAYVPSDYPNYNYLKFLLQNKILQGFSKEGYITDWEELKNGALQVNEIAITNISLVTVPANAQKFDFTETKNALIFKNETKKEGKKHPIDNLIFT